MTPEVDDGQCVQNKLIMNTYKHNRMHSSSDNILFEDSSNEIFKKIKYFYYLKIKEQIEKPDLCSVIYSHEYETDIVPFYAIKNGIYDSDDSDILNVILSLDKDLLQTCEFNNTIQCITNFSIDKNTNKYVINFDVFDKNNALKYIYNKFNPGILTAKYLPLILSISGDKSDDIPGISGYGPSKAIKLVEKNKIPYDLDSIKRDINYMPSIIKDNINIISRNMKLIDFNEQIKRLPMEFLN